MVRMLIDKKKSERTISITVLHIAPTPFFSDRGCHMRIKGIINALNKKAVHNILCTYQHGRNIAHIETIRIARIPGYTKKEPGPSPFKYLADILLFFKACSAIHKRRPHIIHGHLHEGALIGWAARTCFFWRKIPLVFDMQGSLTGELEAHGYFNRFKPLKQVFWMLEYLITRMPNYFVCSSQSSVNILRADFHVKPYRILLASDGYDFEKADPVVIRALKKKINLPVDRPIVIYTGLLMEVKGLSILQKIILEANKRNIHCHFLIVGYPGQVMIDFIEKHGLKDFCTIAGRVPYEQLHNYMGLASIALEPKNLDFGEASGKLLNYMGAGLPTICFDTENNRQILGENGYYASLGSVSEAVDHIQAIVHSSEEGEMRGAAGKARVQECFSWDANVDGIYSIYIKSLVKASER